MARAKARFVVLGAIAVPVAFIVSHEAFRLHTSDELYRIPEAQVSALVAAANQGDVLAAERLEDYFIFWKEDPAHGLVWMRRAAELGSVSARDELIGELSRSDREPDRKEALLLAARWDRHPPR